MKSQHCLKVTRTMAVPADKPQWMVRNIEKYRMLRMSELVFFEDETPDRLSNPK